MASATATAHVCSPPRTQPQQLTTPFCIIRSSRSDDQIADYLDRTKFEARTKHSLVRKSTIRDALLEARLLGYATTDEELEIGLRSIAVPVVNQTC